MKYFLMIKKYKRKIIHNLCYCNLLLVGVLTGFIKKGLKV